MQTKQSEIVDQVESLRVSIELTLKHLIDMGRVPADRRYLEVRKIDFHNRFTHLLELIEGA